MKFLKELLDPVLLVLFYPLMMILTYGHAFHKVPDTYVSMGYTMTNGTGIKAVEALFASIFWPFYWSVQIWS